MKKQFKRTTLLLLAAVMAASMAGCGNGGGNSSTPSSSTPNSSGSSTGASDAAPSRDPIEYELMFSEAASQPYVEETWLFPKVIKEKFNVTLKVMPIPSSSYGDKVNMAIASQSIPDIMNSVDLNTLNDMGSKGMFLNMAKYLDQMPNAQTAFAARSDLSICKASEDAWYALPSKVPSPNLPKTSIDFITMIRGDILKEQGLSVPTTYDELYDVFKALKTAYPDSYPWVTRMKNNTLIWTLAPSVGLSMDITDYTMWDEASGKFKTALDDENFKFLVDFMRKCYAEGLLDQEYAISDTTTWEDKIIAGKGFFSIDYFARPETMTNAAVSGGNTSYTLNPILPPATENGEAKVYAKNVPVSYQGISAKVEAPERLMEVYDWWFFSEEGAMLGYFGEEGVSYTIGNDKKVSYVYSDDANSVTSIASKYGVDYYGFCGLMPGDFGYTIDFENDPNMSDPAKETYRVYQGQTVESCPAVNYTGDALETRKDFTANLQTAMIGEIDKFIMGQRPMSEWDAFIAEFNAQGYDAYIEAKNTML